MMKSVGMYVLRFVAALILSYLVGFALNWLAEIVIFLILTIIPAIFHTMFSVGVEDVASNVIDDSIIGFGWLGHIVTSPDFYARTAAFIASICVVIALAIIMFVASILNYTTRGYRSIGIIASLILLAHYARSVYIVFGTTVYSEVGIEADFWFYAVAICILLISLAITAFIAASSFIDFQNP